MLVDTAGQLVHPPRVSVLVGLKDGDLHLSRHIVSRLYSASQFKESEQGHSMLVESLVAVVIKTE